MNKKKTILMSAPMFRRTSLALAVGLVFGSVCTNGYGQANPSEYPEGRRLDNGRVDLHPVPAPGEREDDIAFPLPSGVTAGDVAAMRQAAGHLPTAPASQTRHFEDSTTGALFVSGKAFLTPASLGALDKLAAELKGKAGLRIAVAGHTDNQRLSPTAKKLFRDNQGLSEARALAVAANLKAALGLTAEQVAIEGYGESRPVASNATPEGMAKNRRVDVRIWYQDAVVAAPVVPRAACESTAAAASGLPFRITVDGEPMDEKEAPLEADRQRCTDVALERADIQVRYDGLAIAPALNVWAWPNAVVRGETVEFRNWSNYMGWIRKAEIRLFMPGQKPQETPLAVLPASWTGPIPWSVPADFKDDQVFYLLRVYDDQGRFDETALKPLSLLVRAKGGFEDAQTVAREKLIGYGETSLVLRNIPVTGGTITVNGTKLKPGQTVETFGLNLPVDPAGKFANKQILPVGPQTVEVKVGNPDGTAVTFRRNLSIPKDDWFYLVVGDLTMGRNTVSGPAALVTGDTQHYEDKVYIDGRGAFYLKGKIKGEYLLTASMDTREQPLNQMFTNFNSKDPRYLLRNINPDLYYPVYGDDSTTVDDAPTQGKFYVRLEKGDSHVMWGNFQTTWSGSELMQFSRGLYGAKGRYRSEEATRWGEKVTQVDAFAADPGTSASREEFRGTGGSLYYLRHQDITMGSERVWVEVRDKDSGLVLDRKQLSSAQDYEVNYLQGRVTLRDPLSAMASSGSLFSSSSLTGNPQFVVITYEYAASLTEINNLSTGLRASHWLNDNLQVGVTAYHQGEQGADQTLKGGDILFRKNPNTYIRIEGAHSAGPGSNTLSSTDGGFGFNTLAATGGDANAYRVDVAADLNDLSEGSKGKVSAYVQDKDRGYSAPGQIVSTNEAVKPAGRPTGVAGHGNDPGRGEGRQPRRRLHEQQQPGGRGAAEAGRGVERQCRPAPGQPRCEGGQRQSHSFPERQPYRHAGARRLRAPQDGWQAGREGGLVGLRLCAGHPGQGRQPQRERPHRRRWSLALQRPDHPECRSFRRQPGSRRQARRGLSFVRPQQCLPQLRGGKRQPGQPLPGPPGFVDFRQQLSCLGPGAPVR